MQVQYSIKKQAFAPYLTTKYTLLSNPRPLPRIGWSNRKSCS